MFDVLTVIKFCDFFAIENVLFQTFHLSEQYPWRSGEDKGVGIMEGLATVVLIDSIIYMV